MILYHQTMHFPRNTVHVIQFPAIKYCLCSARGYQATTTFETKSCDSDHLYPMATLEIQMYQMCARRFENESV